MAADVRDNPEKHRYEIHVDGALAGVIDYELGKDRIALLHTEIDDAFGGQGLGKVLVSGVLADVRARGLAVRPFCPYVRRTIQRNPDDYLDLVRPEDRSEFDLPEEGQ